ncbi:ABC transporter permease [Acetobacter orleanensis]|uniref:Sugar ABC transporter permease n=1 Tax=Acetobacter orleanensis TaxID=104099 RepID=A0A4Y3TSP8_9PROT|nr:ABC transporter permease [Acetobacter orleanensis]KXV67001.1 permease [Acetobacter orleanensis]PCD78302.1 permease [Acetobacter orleanensis]GAN68493.1 ABC transporter polysaccharide/O-antigene exporter [Acetobacter orleanensis JCM 7639]GBR26013.1 polysaccharide/O-antigen exporter permease [Acetobacter orleanensis NRIC 0473]GEB84040.1 sugar ABC transporter permease [Acetobacter orleanensis]
MDSMQPPPAAGYTPAANTPEPALTLLPERGTSYLRHAWQDVLSGMKLARLGATLGWLDIKLRYRGSILGPFWLTASTAVMVAAMGVLYAYLMNMDVHKYLPFLTLSLVLWGFVGSTLQDGCTTFTSASGLIHSARMPYSLHVLRATVRNLLTVAHNIPVVIVVFLWFRVAPTWSWTTPVACGLWIVDSFMATLLLGILGARFRDVPPIVASTLQILFFVTPILWAPELMKTGQDWLLLDPFFPLMEILRTPFTGDTVKAAVWPAALAWSAGLTVFTFALFARMRARLAYWV